MANTFNPPDKKHTGHFRFETMAKDIESMEKIGYVFRGRIKRVKEGGSTVFKYYVKLSCGCSVYKTMRNMRLHLSTTCGDCCRKVASSQIMKKRRKELLKNMEVYQENLIEGAVALDIVDTVVNQGRRVKKLKYKCSCGKIRYTRITDMNTYLKKESKTLLGTGCKSCVRYTVNYGNYAPAKIAVNNIIQEINHDN